MDLSLPPSENLAIPLTHILPLLQQYPRSCFILCPVDPVTDNLNMWTRKRSRIEEEQHGHFFHYLKLFVPPDVLSMFTFWLSVHVSVPGPIIKSCKMNLDQMTVLCCYLCSLWTPMNMWNRTYDIVGETHSEWELLFLKVLYGQRSHPCISHSEHTGSVPECLIYCMFDLCPQRTMCGI